MEPLRVLAVDDEPGMRTGILRALRDFRVRLADLDIETGLIVDAVETGEEALAHIKSDQPDILLLDHKLPGMSGLDVLDHVTSQNDKMVTVMVTAYASLDTAVTAIKRGAYDFLAKPFTPDELRRVVTKAAESLLLARHALALTEEKKRVRFQFISVLAHELKSPLNAIVGYLGLMRDGAFGADYEARDHAVERCITRAEGMGKMIRDLLDLTAVESGQKPRVMGTLNIVEIFLRAVESVQPGAAAHSISINVEAPPKVEMWADAWEIETIANNLVTNAVKYNKDGGAVTITLTCEDDELTAEVADTGIGMTADEAARLFTDFTRIKSPKTRDILGSGLGLSTLRKIVALYDGRVSVRSEPDVGSTFTVVLAMGHGEVGVDE